MIDKMDVGKRLSALRKREGYSQAEFSELLNVSPQAISKWETGVSLPDIGTLLDMSWICKVSINSILEGDDYTEGIGNIGREHVFMDKILLCPQCRQPLKLKKVCDSPITYACDSGHSYAVVDGVLDFNTREIPGELWSLAFRNYEGYLREHHRPRNPNYRRGLSQADVMWQAIEKKRPKVILDMACGQGMGIKQQIERINWPVTIIMVDISHRILKWNKVFYATECRNPFVDMVYLACDGANLPLKDGSVDLVFSYGGYESMQAKMMAGLSEANRVLKDGGCSVYTKSVVEDFESENSKAWMNLLLSAVSGDEEAWWKKELVNVQQWEEYCRAVGFKENACTKIYGELPAPNTGVFPFENEMAQWMAEYVFVSTKLQKGRAD
ncbi:helix-turn-helix domain-containing protein [Hydrogeniiclostridium mannosilyticum]|uniref:helix-turn-helix domain-containing protein n=1 Tax=Hydrogeniiclostridium mannosilyticum TaxID=2764322 RepID=UPI0018AA32E8|nr:helix-turn-helix domain-containing protein [Hydrogeniiclostridium mannosilyticum]